MVAGSKPRVSLAKYCAPSSETACAVEAANIRYMKKSLPSEPVDVSDSVTSMRLRTASRGCEVRGDIELAEFAAGGAGENAGHGLDMRDQSDLRGCEQ
mmetsp:Transcript_7691/g.14371  ORF Transcript_7691/g.14371 Transcript_7691/m.14371 type:complete len:98 (+) Transcript_7691:1193-1486(+)